MVRQEVHVKGRWNCEYCRYGILGASLNASGWAGIAQLARASAFQAEGRGFESRFPLQNQNHFALGKAGSAHIAQAVERILGKDEVIGSSPIVGSIFCLFQGSIPKK